MKKIRNKSTASSVGLIFVILLTIFIPGHMFGWGVERIFIILITLLGIFCLVCNKKLKSWLNINPNVITAVFMLLTIIGILGYFSAVIIYTINTGIRDYIELLRWPICMIFILFVARFFNKQHVDVFNKGITASLLYCLFVYFLYKFHFPFLSSFFTDIIYSDAKTWFTSDGYGRLSVPFENPNFLAFYLNLVFTYLIFFIKSSKRKRYLSFMLVVFLLYLTGSRSGWFCTFIILSTWVLYNLQLMFTKANFKALISLMALVLILYCGFNIISPAINTNYRIQIVRTAIESGGITNEANLAGRINQMKQSWEYTSRAPFFGWGSAKYGLMEVTDSQYFTWLFRYGLIGTTIILIICLYVIINLLRLASFNLKYIYGLLALFFHLFIILGTGAFLDNFRLLFITVFLLQVIWLILSDDLISITNNEGDILNICYR